MFGRGMRAGIDRREQKQAATAVEKEMMHKLRDAAGITETREMRQHQRDKEKLAEKYDGFDMRVLTMLSKGQD